MLTGVVSWGSGLVHRREGLMDESIVKIALRGAIPGAVLGAIIVSLLDDKLDFTFKLVTMVVVGWANYKTWKKMRGESSQISEPMQTELREGWVTAGAGMGGLACSSMAIGAGAIYIPVFHEYGGLRARKAIGTSLGTMMFVVPTAILSHAILLQGQLPDWDGWSHSHSLFCGANSGAKFGMRFDDGVILKCFLVLISISSSVMESICHHTSSDD
ncbi:MAG: hypothetical protein Ct9H90mP16_04940 [Candidatus Poseidoniales archaeon]|nr:MAG: hypothetical protein Ct9H90mP16_04940 [Candidatus Poseidoniales archaeon]